MKTFFLFSLMLTATFCNTSRAKDPACDPARFLEMRGTEFYLDGKPFYEISYNKYDLFWQILDAMVDNPRSEFETSESFNNAERALRELHEMGFKTIRTFGSEYKCRAYRDPANHEAYFKAVDYMLDLCDRYDIRVVYCLNLTSFIAEGETEYDLLTDPASRSREFMDEYLRTIVTRYRDRAAIAMWEVQNELLLMADIGGREGIWMDRKVPTLTQVIDFHRHVNSVIKSIDKRHLVTTGDGIRSTLWHQNRYCEHLDDSVEMWDMDTWSQNSSIISTVQNTVDVYGFHAYYNGRALGMGKIIDDDTGEERLMTLSEWKEEAARNNSAFYLGEWGAQPYTPENFPDLFKENPDWFTSFVDDKEHALVITARTLDMVVDAGIQLTHYWTYSSDVSYARNNPLRMDISLRRNPELVKVLADANRRLQLENMGFTYMKSLPDLYPELYP